MKKLIHSLLFLFISFTFILPQKVIADGFMIKPDPYSDRWDYSEETEQKAFINYENGFQKMIISVGYKPTDQEDLMWIFPVPSNPEDISIDVLKSVPQLNGEEISLKAKSKLDGIKESLLATQIYPIFIFNFVSHELLYVDSTSTFSVNLSGGKLSGNDQDVIVYQHMVKEGITSEVLTAKTATGLLNYLSEQGLDVDINSIPVLNDYIGKEYSFIVSWIESSSYLGDSITSSELASLLQLDQQGRYPIAEPNYSSREKGIFISFPTRSLYFPLIPTSVYGSKVVPATIRVLGHTSPKVFDEIEPYTKVEYYLSRDYDIYQEDSFSKSFYNGDEKILKYTKIEIDSPSDNFIDDLWIKRRAPLKTHIVTFLVQHEDLFSSILLVISSVLTSLIVGLVIFNKLEKKYKKILLLGLSNCLTVLFLMVCLILTRTKEDKPEHKKILNELKQKKYILKSRIATLLLILFLLTIPILIFILSGNVDFGSNFIPFIVSGGLLSAIIILRKKSQEDKVSIDILKSNGYSTWTFLPKDSRKFAFLSTYTIFFLIVVYGLIELIEILL
jgi:hypothetical protein